MFSLILGVTGLNSLRPHNSVKIVKSTLEINLEFIQILNNPPPSYDMPASGSSYWAIPEKIHTPPTDGVVF